MFGRLLVGLFCWLLLVLSNSAYSEKNLQNAAIYSLTLEELFAIEVVSAVSGFEQKVSDAPATVTIIDKQQWQAMGATSLSEVLSTVAGVHVGQPKFFSYYNTSFTIRGLSGLASEKVKILIDGMPFENMHVNGLMWGFYMPLSGFSRIEVIKGPGSAVYGADAFAGIINLVTLPVVEKQNDDSGQLDGQLDIQHDIALRVGSFDDVDIMSESFINYGAYQLMMAFDYTRSNDDSGKIVTSDLQSNLDAIFGSNASLAPGHLNQGYEVFKFISKWRYNHWSADYLKWKNFDAGLGTGSAQALTDDGYLNHSFERFTLNYRLENWFGGSLDWRYSYMDQLVNAQLDVFPNGAVLPINSQGNVSFTPDAGLTQFTEGLIGKVSLHGMSNTFDVTHLVDFGDNDYLRWQLGYEKQTFNAREAKNFGPTVLDGSQSSVDGQLTDVSGTPLVFIKDVDRYFWYASVHRHWQLSEDVMASAGFRYDSYSDFGSTTNPRFSVIWQISEQFSIKLFAGSAFKAPTIEQLYAQNNPATLGNPDLSVERIDTLELGNSLQYKANDDLIFGLSLFRYKAKDLIVHQPNADSSGLVAQNVGEQLGYGAEFSVKWKPYDSVMLDGHYSYTKAEDGSGLRVAGLPTSMAYLGINWQINERLNFTSSTKWVDTRTRVLADNRAPVSSYMMSNLTFNYQQVFKDFDGAIIFKNLLNKMAVEPSDGTIAGDFPLAGRQVLLQLSLDL